MIDLHPTFLWLTIDSSIPHTLTRTHAQFVVSGVVASLYEFSMGHQLEFLKIMKQTKPGSYFELLKGIVGQKGVVGLWDGFFPWGLIQAIAKGVRMYATYVRYVRRLCVCVSVCRMVAREWNQITNHWWTDRPTRSDSHPNIHRPSSGARTPLRARSSCLLWSGGS